MVVILYKRFAVVGLVMNTTHLLWVVVLAKNKWNANLDLGETCWQLLKLK